MCSVIAVLTMIISVINIANFINVNADAEMKLDIIAENGGSFPRDPMNSDRFSGKADRFDRFSPEAPFDTRYFTVFLSSDGAVVAIDTGKIAAVETQTAQEYALYLYSENRTDGFYAGYKFRAFSFGDGKMYVFLDCSREMSAFYSFLLVSITVSILGILLVFLLVMFLSRLVIKPIIESYEKQKRFITDAGHEIKTPLTIIDAGADVLEMENGENEWTKSIKNQVRRLSELTEKLIFLSRMDEEGKTLKISEFSLTDIAREGVESFEAVAETKGKTLTTSIENDIMMNGDKEAVTRLFSILLDNAMKYSDENGKIHLSLNVSGKNREIKVYNTVDSIEKGKHDELFERFYRKDSSRNSKTGGHGIGLSSAKAIVSAHKGKISAYSADGKSIVFTVSI